MIGTMGEPKEDTRPAKVEDLERLQRWERVSYVALRGPKVGWIPGGFVGHCVRCYQYFRGGKNEVGELADCCADCMYGKEVQA